MRRSDLLVVGSFEWDSVRRFHDLLPTVAVEEFDYQPDALARVRRQRESPHAEHDLSIPASVDNPNSPKTMRQALHDSSRSYITTDYPDVLFNLRNGLAPFGDAEAIVIDDLELGDGVYPRRTAVLRNAGAATVDCRGWYLWTGVATPINVPDGHLSPGNSTRVELAPPRGKNVSWIHAIALHDATHRLVDLYEYWAFQPVA
jgi:hypothetical protein